MKRGNRAGWNVGARVPHTGMGMGYMIWGLTDDGAHHSIKLGFHTQEWGLTPRAVDQLKTRLITETGKSSTYRNGTGLQKLETG